MANYEVTCHLLAVNQFKAEEILQEVFSPCYWFVHGRRLVSKLKALALIDVTCRERGLSHCNPLPPPPRISQSAIFPPHHQGPAQLILRAFVARRKLVRRRAPECSEQKVLIDGH